MARSAQAGARRVVAVLAVGLGIALTVMAFAPATPDSSPGAAMVGIHEANYGVWGHSASPMTYYFRVHTGVELFDAEEFDSIAYWIESGEREKLVDSLITYHGYKIWDERAVGILEAIRLPEDTTTDTHRLKVWVGTRYEEKDGYWFHVALDIAIVYPEEPGLHKQFIRWLQEGNYAAIRGVLISWIRQGLIQGQRPEAIVPWVKRAEAPTRSRW